MIRTSKLSTKLINKNKSTKLDSFIVEYKKVVQYYIDYLWNKLDDNYNCSKFISTKDYESIILSQRAIKCASTQACGIVKSNTEKARKLIWIIDKLKKENKDTFYFEQKLINLKINKPEIKNNFNCELNSICCDLMKRNGIWFLQLKSIGKNFGKIRIPIKPHRQTLKWLKQGKILNSFLISNNYVNLRFEIKNELKKEGKIIGLDQGITSCITLSDGQISVDDNHGWNLSKILSKLCKKKKGSKGFKRIQELRKNYINWSINQLNLSNIRQLNVEKLHDVRRNKKVDKFRSYWTYTLIMDKLKRYCEEQKVFVKEQCCVYRSQRCNVCGLVRKSQRKGKIYKCQCGYIGDSDLNASLNHEIELPEVGFIRQLNYNKILKLLVLFQMLFRSSNFTYGLVVLVGLLP